MSQYDEEKDNFETKISIDNGVREIAFIKSDAKKNVFKEIKDINKFIKSVNNRQYSSKNSLVCDNDITNKKEVYQIAISKNGKFVATFDSANLRIKILENTDCRPFKIGKKKDMELNNDNNSDRIKKTIVHFKLKTDLTIDKFYSEGFIPPLFNGSSSNDDDKKFRWSFDISNVCMNENKHFIYVAISCIVDDDMRRTIDGKEKKKGTTVIYSIELIKNNQENYVLNKNTDTFYQIHEISGICRFAEIFENKVSDNEFFVLKRFIIFNFYGIHSFSRKDSFKLDMTFNYPKNIRRELDSLDPSEIYNCISILYSCICGKYFLVEQYKNNVQLLEVYDLTTMKLDTITKRVEKSQDKLLRRYNRNVYSISMNKSQLCFTRGLRSVKLYFMENGLEVTSKKFNKLEKIHSLEFIENDRKILVIGETQNKKLKYIIWDIYNNEETKPTSLDKFLTINNFGKRLAGSPGNLLQVNDEGNVISILKWIEKSLKLNQEKNVEKKFPPQDLKHFKDKKPDGSLDKRHIIYYNKNINPDFKSIVSEKEPWVLGDYDRHSYCLHQNKNGSEIDTLQLIVGRSTVQIWHQVRDDSKPRDELPNKGEPFLEYIWTNGIPVNQERKKTRLRIETFKYGSNDDKSKLTDFYLKVYWYERASKKVDEKELEKIIVEDNKIIDKLENKVDKKVIMETENNNEEGVGRREKVIRCQDVIDKISAIRCACKALEYINKRTKFLVNYVKEHRCEEIVAYINHIICRFIKCKPEDYKLLDVRYNVMKNLILGDCDHLIKFTLFENNDEDKKATKLHIPRNMFWKKGKFIDDDTKNDEITNVMELAIHHCKGREIKDTIIVAYLLEYYSRHATDYAGWMSTVSKALPLLFKYNYDDCVTKLFRKECFANQNYFSAQDPYNIIPEEYQERRNHNIKFRAFGVNLRSNEYKWYGGILKSLESLKIKTYKFFGELDNNDVEKKPLALRVVPLPEFTTNRINQQEEVECNIILKIIYSFFIPRWYKIGRDEKHKLSPFSRVVYYENNDDIYDNPATEAIIDFRWKKAKNFFFLLFLRFLLFIFCFGLINAAYLDHGTIINVEFLVLLIIIFYYLAAFLFITEVIQLFYHGPRKYFGDIYNIFDIISIILPIIVMSIMLRDFHYSNGFGNVEIIDTKLIVWMSVTIFFLWMEAISYLRLIPNIATYIYYVKIITKAVFPFLLFNIVVIMAFAHTMLILLKETKNIETKDTTFSGTATNPVNGQELDVKMKADFHPDDMNDNPFSYFPTAIVATYYWLNGDFIQRDEFDFWAVEVLSLIASILLVTILQNMLIAFMGGVYQKAETKGRQALLRFRANQIANYEALHHYNFWPYEPDPKYIYYVSQSKIFVEWYNSRKNDQDPIYSDFENKSTYTKHVFEEKNYDIHSIWDYEEDNKMKINKNDDKNKNVKQKNKVDNIEKEIKNDDNIKDIKKDIKDDDIEAIKEDIKKIGIENMKNMNDIIGRLLKTLN
ncbi:uncharacterized protein OCT59_015485 [Rhizophagus irregularis]|uniref:Ion transport domain-containing protein n=1 Tax=Rhizophagus irregularis (strain DAOM 181602 / DAOM 197198 / MUCL 43194) TaxID=747089 RepID=A0A2P4QDJ7_RHIID|nr:hypothetical protein GLOIN_2v1838566 [Rhizophagus irregularis DAOM 181602=DAOM 197198]POG75697.1 hypothetical protein GLOIN_2v1838566 [Rhizophagus irregularis DAOM 181602=DAOM 197198]UZO23141.1 hypothetical protein OCT59_015485 [Rhizophagus irregularis]|eukprot:XP_025182563.1 hypothetical protein GLOIN_2v1838566 [Rhizophagus irregularis DAOM 181602=DAOM 197198]